MSALQSAHTKFIAPHHHFSFFCSCFWLGYINADGVDIVECLIKIVYFASKTTTKLQAPINRQVHTLKALTSLFLTFVENRQFYVSG